MTDIISISPTEEGEIIKTTQGYEQEAEDSKKDRMDLNELNYDVFHLRGTFSHKQEGQSREFLSKQALAVEQISSFFSQGLIDTDNWYRVERKNGVQQEDTSFLDGEVEKILGDQLDKNEFIPFVGDAVKSGLLGSLMIVKVGGKLADSVKYEVEEIPDEDQKTPVLGNFTTFFDPKKQILKRIKDKKWELDLNLIRQEDFYPDPTGGDLYILEKMFLDFHEIERLSQGDDAIFDPAVVEKLRGTLDTQEDERHKLAKEQGQNVTTNDFRRRIKIVEGWGTILNSRGEILHENVTWAIANDSFLIMKPRMNPFWHGKKPYVVAPLIRVPGSVWHKALMDSPTQNNIALNEIYNLLVDGGLMEAHGIKQVRSDWLEDDSEVASGIRPGQTLRANASMPPGAKVLERVDTGSVSPGSLQMFQIISAEFNASALTNDLRLGQIPQRSVKATEVVEASNSITSLFTGIAKTLEVIFIEKLLDLSWQNCLQNLDTFNSNELK